MNFRIEVSCTADKVIEAIHDVHKMLQGVDDIISIEMKVFNDINRNADKGHNWVTIYRDSNPRDLVTIWDLRKKLRESQ